MWSLKDLSLEGFDHFNILGWRGTNLFASYLRMVEVYFLEGQSLL